MGTNGRQLSTATAGSTAVSYKYDMVSGMRLSKKVGSTTYQYYYAGDKLMRMTVSDGTVMDFFYDHLGQPYAVDYNGTKYYYILNQQGDVVRLVSKTGTSYGVYRYDAWGNILYSTNAALIRYNPLRYRGYVYDNETNMYYCQSRYYDPAIGRFINADNQIAGVGGEVLGYNMFAYCMNNPVNMSDPSGNWSQWIKNTVRWVAKNIVKPVVKTVQKTLSKVDLTYSTGVNVSGTPSAWIFNGQIGVSMDTKGNVAIQASGGGGVTGGTPSISISGYRSITNAPSINELNGMGYQIGGSAIVPVEGVPVAVGGDFNIIPNSERNRTYYGGTLTGGLAAGSPGGELHVEWGTTVTLPKTQFNIYDVARSVYIKIMEW